MRSFFLTWPIRQTVSSESSPAPVARARPWRLDELAQVFTLPWSAYVRLLSVKDEHARRFYEAERSEEHTSELQSLMRISYAVFCLKKKKTKQQSPKDNHDTHTHQVDQHQMNNINV